MAREKLMAPTTNVSEKVALDNAVKNAKTHESFRRLYNENGVNFFYGS